MSKIKTPQEFYLEDYDGQNTGFDFAQAYHEYAMKAVIEELEKLKSNEVSRTVSIITKAIIDKAIEIIKSRI